MLSATAYTFDASSRPNKIERNVNTSKPEIKINLISKITLYRILIVLHMNQFFPTYSLIRRIYANIFMFSHFITRTIKIHIVVNIKNFFKC